MVIVLFVGIGISPVIVRTGKIRINPDSLCIIGYSAVIAFLIGIGSTPVIVVYIGKIRINPDSLCVIGNGTVIVFLVGISNSPVIVCLSIL
jgi:hypothetical protein